MRGSDGPYMSASSSPTLSPLCASATARFTATVDLPTPPLPEATAITAFTSGSRGAACGAAGGRGRFLRGQHDGGILHPGQSGKFHLDLAAQRLKAGRLLAFHRQAHLHQPTLHMDPLEHFFEVEGSEGGADIVFGHDTHGLTEARPLSRPLRRSPRDRTLLIMTKLTSLLCALLLFAGFAAHAAPPEPPALADLAAKVMPAVVSIASTDPVNATPDDTLDGSGSADHPTADTTPTAGTVLPPPRAEEALGSGFIFDPAGYVLTNNHVIDGAASITVTLQDGTILPATLVGRDTAADLAVLKIDAGHKLPFVTFGNSGKLRVGDWVLAIGNPFGLPGSTSAGIVSALNRDINEGAYDDFIQTDAAINRGNSGGPLFDLQGQVIGVDSAIYSPSGGSIGIGFAIPSAMAMPVAYELKNTGSMTRGWLGVATQEVTPAIQHLLGLPNTAGALVGGVAADGPAAGKLQPGDVLVSLAGVPVTDPRALLIRTAEIPAGQNVVAQFWRDGTERQATHHLDRAAGPDRGHAAQRPSRRPRRWTSRPSASRWRRSRRQAGVSITAVTGDGPAAKAGIVAGDVIEEVSGQTVATAAALQSQLKALDAADTKVATLLVSGDVADGSDPGPALGAGADSEIRKSKEGRFLKKAAQKLLLIWAMGLSPTRP